MKLVEGGIITLFANGHEIMKRREFPLRSKSKTVMVRACTNINLMDELVNRRRISGHVYYNSLKEAAKAKGTDWYRVKQHVLGGGRVDYMKLVLKDEAVENNSEVLIEINPSGIGRVTGNNLSPRLSQILQLSR